MRAVASAVDSLLATGHACAAHLSLAIRAQRRECPGQTGSTEIDPSGTSARKVAGVSGLARSDIPPGLRKELLTDYRQDARVALVALTVTGLNGEAQTVAQAWQLTWTGTAAELAAAAAVAAHHRTLGP